MDEIDLDITNYSMNDIKYFFRLDEIPNYTSDDITQQVYTIRTELMGDMLFPQDLKRKFMDFVDSAKKRLYEGEDIKQSTLNKPLIQETTIDYPEQTLSSLLTRKTEITKHPTAQYIHSDPSSIFKGELNPLNNRILTRSLTIDSKFRENRSITKSNDFTINLPTKLSKIASMQLNSIEFPISFYGISANYGNNTFTLNVIDIATDTIDSSANVVVPDGNYSATELVGSITTGLSNLGAPYSAITMTYNSTNGKCSFTHSNVSKKFDIIFNQNSSAVTDNMITMGYILGFAKDSYEILTSITSEGVVNPSPIDYVYLAIEDFNQNVNNGFISATNNNVTSSDIIARITVNNDYFKVMNNTNQNIVTDPREYFGPVDITRMRIRVYDCYGRLLDMNNVDYSFCLTMKQIYNL